ncbi:MAG: 4-hydroxy-2-oxoheptanedioate aldolase [Gammaproteobacteria bacterium]
MSENSNTATINPLKARLKAGKPCVGILVTIPNVGMVQTLADAGYDWLFIDMEHGPITIESAHAMIAATKGTRSCPLVRVPWNVHWLVKPVLDAGAMGIIFPMIRSADEARKAVSAMRYPPGGQRGSGPFFAPARFGLDTAEYTARADEELFTLLLIEHRDAVDDIDNIIKVPGIDACLIAPFDLSMSYGFQDGPDHPEVQEAIERVERAVLPTSIALGGFTATAEAANEKIAKGYKLALTGYDIMLLRQATDALLNAIDRGD